MSHRNRMWKEKIICGLLTVLLLFGVGSRVYAAGEDGVSVYLPISQTFDGNQTERVVYQLTALEANAPMPEGSADGSYTFAMTGAALILAFLTLVFIRRVRLNRTANDREK